MAVKIRLTRLGDKRTPFYRVVVADSRTARDGKVVVQLGTYDPLKKPAEIKLDKELTASWLKKGAQPTETARTILVTAGIIAKKDAKPYSPKGGKAKKAEDAKAEPSGTAK